MCCTIKHTIDLFHRNYKEGINMGKPLSSIRIEGTLFRVRILDGTWCATMCATTNIVVEPTSM